MLQSLQNLFQVINFFFPCQIKMITSSIYAPEKISHLILQLVEGASFRPNGIILNSDIPNGVVNAVVSQSSFQTGTYQ